MTNTKPKVIISTYDDVKNPYYGGGGAIAIHEIAKRLMPHFDVQVITGNYKGAKNKKIDNISYKRIGLSFLGPKAGQLFYHLTLPFYILSQKHDIWIENFTPPISTSFTPLFTKKPVIGFVQMLASEDMERKYKIPFHLVENMGLKKYRYFIVSTQVSKKKIITKNPQAKFFVLPIGTSVRPTLSNSIPKHFLYLGRIEFNQKGLDLLIDAYASVEKNVSYPLVIAGTGNKKDIQILKEYIHLKKLAHKIVLKGKVEGKEKDKLLKEAKAVIIPSRFDTFITVALEAMAYQKPLLGFDIDGTSWIPNSRMTKVKPYNSKKLGKELLQMSLKSEKKVGKKDIDINGFHWDTLITKYIVSIRQVLNSHG